MPQPLPHTDFNSAFRDGTVFACPERGQVPVRVVPAGELFLPSGEIIACDPGNFGWPQSPFVLRQQPGRYPVELAVVKDDHNAFHERVAAARIVFAEGIPKSWEMARTTNDEREPLPVGKFFGYGVDIGMGCFVDRESLDALQIDDAGRFYEQTTLPAIEADLTSLYVNLKLDSKTGANAILFCSGHGDGAYPSYWGRTKSGDICCLATDFGLLTEHLMGKATVRLRDVIDGTAKLDELQSTGIRVEADPRPDPRAFPYDHGCCLRMHGDICTAIIMNGNQEYSSERLGYEWSDGKGTFNFRFAEPLDPKAKIRFEYSLGVRALPVATPS